MNHKKLVLLNKYVQYYVPKILLNDINRAKIKIIKKYAISYIFVHNFFYYKFINKLIIIIKANVQY